VRVSVRVCVRVRVWVSVDSAMVYALKGCASHSEGDRMVLGCSLLSLLW
jgi:hypothetical protein